MILSQLLCFHKEQFILQINAILFVPFLQMNFADCKVPNDEPDNKILTLTVKDHLCLLDF